MNISTQIPSVNCHLWKPCNMRCRFCFASFQDVGQDDLPEGHLPRNERLAVVEALATAGFDKMNFVGGEPILCPWLPDLIRRVTDQLQNRFPQVASLLDEAGPDVLDLLQLPTRPLEEDLVQQPPGASQQGDPATHRCCGHLP